MPKPAIAVSQADFFAGPSSVRSSNLYRAMAAGLVTNALADIAAKTGMDELLSKQQPGTSFRGWSYH